MTKSTSKKMNIDGELFWAIISGVIAFLTGIFINPRNDKFWEVLFAQFINAITMATAAYFVSKIQSKKQGEELLKQRARLSIRRIRNLLNNMKEFNNTVFLESSYLKDNLSKDAAELSLRSIAHLVTLVKLNEYVTNDIFEDWADLVPEEIESFKEQAREEESWQKEIEKYEG